MFQPYAGVKTSILILDKKLNQKSGSIFFAKIENDGFSLGAQRTPIQKNDLSDIAQFILEFAKNNYVVTSDNCQAIEKSEIQKKDFNLSAPSYKSISTSGLLIQKNYLSILRLCKEAQQ